MGSDPVRPAGREGAAVLPSPEPDTLGWAALSLYRPDQSAARVTSRLAELVAELGLAADPVYLPAREPLPEAEAPGTAAVAVRRPDGSLAGVLRCRPAGPGAAESVRVLAAHAGVALAGVGRLREVARREAVLRRVAEHLQDALLPALPDLPHTVMAVSYRAAARDARVGGDFYDAFPMPCGRVLITVGDVMGKGLEAAAHTSRITQTLRALALQGLDLDVLLERADAQVTWQSQDVIATVWCGLYDPASGEIAFASLGHPPALLLRAGGEPIRLELEGLPMGMRDLSGSPPEVRSRRLAPRDLLVLYTDGVVEASRDYLAGQQALLAAIARRREEPVGTILAGALQDLLDADTDNRDDAVMLLLRRS